MKYSIYVVPVVLMCFSQVALTDEVPPNEGIQGAVSAEVPAKEDIQVALPAEMPCKENMRWFEFAELPGQDSSASAKMGVCEEYEGKFSAKLAATGLAPQGKYVLSINGDEGARGNIELGKWGRVFNKEGYVDLPAFRADTNGEFRGILSAPGSPPPATYEVRAFIKELPSYRIILQVYPGFSFIVIQPKVVAIVEPVDEAEVSGSQIVVRGNVSKREYAYIYVLVNPLLASDKFWVQPEPFPPGRNGKWNTVSYLGAPDKGAGESFRILAVASSVALPLKEGQVLSRPEVLELMRRHSISEPVEVKRSK